MSDARGIILIVDDDEEIREVISEMVRQMEFEVTDVPSTAEARKWLDKNVPMLVILDIMMPGGNGLVLCRWIRAQPRLESTPVLLNSGLKDDATMRDGMELGAVDFIQKPFNIKTLKEKITKYLGKARS